MAEVKQPKIISIMHRKGGVGKSTTTMTLASYLNFKGKNVMILDLDNKNQTCVQLRKINVEEVESLTPKSKVFQTYMELKRKDKIYYIGAISPSELENKISLIKANNADFKIDYIFIDSPGGVEDSGFKATLKVVEHILVPMINDLKNVANTIEYFKIIEKNKSQMKALKSLNIFFNNVEYSLDHAITSILESGISQENMLMSPIKHNKQSKTGQLQTIIPMTNDFIEDFVKEFIKKTN